MLEFTWPFAFLALPLPWLVYKLMARAPRQDASLLVPFFEKLTRLQSDNESISSSRLLNLICCSLIWLLVVLAASRPQWLGDPVELPSTGRDLMLAVDISGSMEAQDMVVGNRQVSRIDVVKAVVSDFVERREGDRLGLILFAAHAYIQAPLTFDRDTVGTLLEEAEIGIIEESATAIGDAIGLGVKHLRNRPENSRVLVLLTDGVNNAGSVSPIQAGQLAETENIKIYTIGIGADQVVQRTFFGSRSVNPSAELDEETLTQIAESTGGRYFRARDVNDLVEIYEELDRLETIEQDEQTYRPTKILFFWPLGAALLISFILAAVSIPWLSLLGRQPRQDAEGVSVGEWQLMEFMLPNWQEFHFLRPLWLLALIPVVLFLAALWRINSSVSAWDRAIDKSLLPFLLDRSRNAAQGTPLALLAGAWILSVIALAGPVWEKLPQPVQQREDALVIVQDLSLSMFAPDHVPNRLDLAKRKLRDILDQRDEGQTALVVYAGDAHAVTPLTDDAVTIAALVPSLSPNIMPLFGSNPGAALDVAISLLNDIEASRGRILLITDGIAGFAEEQMLAEKMAETDYELLIMGVGTEEGAPIRTSDGGFLTDVNGETVIPTLNRNVLESLANRTGGRYHDIQLSNADINYLLADSPFFDETLSEVEEEFDIWYEAGPWLMLLIVPFAALSFRRGWLFGLALLFTLTGTLTPTRQAQAWEWRDLWQTSDQQGAKAMEAENFEDAAGLFENRNWQGAAMYRSENYESAIAAFSSDISADGHYNRGNALALTGNYEQAIAAYDEALELQPDHADALHNKEIVEQLLQEQESQEGESEGENSEQQQQEGSEQEQENQDNSDQQQQESQEGNQDQEQQQQQQQQPEEQEGSESNSEQNTPSEETNEQFEEQQSLEQWLRRIEDDPGELLQRKFRYEYRQRQLNGTANNLQSGEQIW